MWPILVHNSSNNAYIIDSLLLGLSIIHNDLVPVINRYFHRLSSTHIAKLKASKRLIFVANNPNPAHWGLISLEIASNQSGFIYIYDSSHSAGMLAKTAHQVLEWANNVNRSLEWRDWWPHNWALRLNDIVSSQQVDSFNCGVFTCMNGLTLSHEWHDFTWVARAQMEALRIQIYESLRQKSIVVTTPFK